MIATQLGLAAAVILSFAPHLPVDGETRDPIVAVMKLNQKLTTFPIQREVLPVAPAAANTSPK